jgi:hypothetical protein
MRFYLDSGDDRDKPPQMLGEMVSRGQLVVKTGWVLCTYPDSDYERPSGY